MTEIVSTLQYMYNQTMEMRDRRVDDWFLMGSPWPTAVFCFLYIYSVKFFGPRYMKGREPFEIRRVLLFYNVSMVIFSFYLFSEGIQVWGREYSLRCQPVDYSNNPKSLKIARACYWYYISKFVEFTDTIFFVLRKKFSQVSTLHVIHHGVMPMSVWFGVRFTPGGHSTFFGLLNTFVHIFMYTYYAIAALGPKYQKFLWWKRYMTAIQMLQFILVMVHSFQLLFVDCNYPRAFVWWIGGHAIMFLFLFADFYKSSYVRRSAANGALEPKAKMAVNGKQNGHAPHLNGAVKAIANGTSSNGKATNGTTTNGTSNGSSNGTSNGTANGTTNGEAKKNGDIRKNGHVKHD